jgi:hypothetical protein
MTRQFAVRPQNKQLHLRILFAPRTIKLSFASCDFALERLVHRKMGFLLPCCFTAKHPSTREDGHSENAYPAAADTKTDTRQQQAQRASSAPHPPLSGCGSDRLTNFILQGGSAQDVHKQELQPGADAIDDNRVSASPPIIAGAMGKSIPMAAAGLRLLTRSEFTAWLAALSPSTHVAVLCWPVALQPPSFDSWLDAAEVIHLSQTLMALFNMHSPEVRRRVELNAMTGSMQ